MYSDSGVYSDPVGYSDSVTGSTISGTAPSEIVSSISTNAPAFKNPCSTF